MGITKIVNVFLENVSHALKKLTTCISNNGQNVQCALQSYCVKCFNTFVDFLTVFVTITNLVTFLKIKVNTKIFL